MPISIKMPSLSPTMTEGKLAKWLKKKGDQVLPGDIIAEIETDKATMEIEAVDEGVLFEIKVDEGAENVLVGSTIATIMEENDSENDMMDLEGNGNIEGENNLVSIENKNKNLEFNEKKVTSDLSLDKTSSENRIRISPLAKRLALKNNISYREIKGSGPYGRIVKKDIENYDNLKETFDNNLNNKIDLKKNNFSDVPLSPMRKVIAQRLINSVNEAPHFFLSVDCNISEINKIRNQINSDNLKISVNDFIVKASAKALKNVPKANCSWNDNFIRYYNNFDISVAVAIDDGLITPIVRNAESKGLGEISKEIKDLVDKAKKGNLTPEEYQGGNFTVSNLGMYGIKNFTAIINPPQSMILAIGKAEKKPLIINNEIQISEIMSVTLSCDHRVVDGALGSVWLNKFKSYIENPSLMLI
ncbi:MAG: pyruvate dehydrogenase complex dihydrolipoamide acetyltransferase [SAR116 cluster bacterium]|nr:pyruvate dehydrogenase complex dihydrolipoamide acetyltransferase [SAR116 cluster bacterium]